MLIYLYTIINTALHDVHRQRSWKRRMTGHLLSTRSTGELTAMTPPKGNGETIFRLQNVHHVAFKQKTVPTQSVKLFSVWQQKTITKRTRVDKLVFDCKGLLPTRRFCALATGVCWCCCCTQAFAKPPLRHSSQYPKTKLVKTQAHFKKPPYAKLAKYSIENGFEIESRNPTEASGHLARNTR